MQPLTHATEVPGFRSAWQPDLAKRETEVGAGGSVHRPDQLAAAQKRSGGSTRAQRGAVVVAEPDKPDPGEQLARPVVGKERKVGGEGSLRRG